jgi:glucans biosynthesis protein C
MKNVNRSLNPLLALRFIEMPRLTLVDQSKNTYVETLRGFAIILVVFGHIIGSNSSGGMRVSDDSVFRYLYFTLEYIRMPLFTVISGWVYANKPIDASGSGKFILGKLRRLILPMFVITTILFLLRMVIPGTNTKPTIAGLPYIYVFPYDLYWYLYSLFIIFIVVVLLEQVPFFRKIEGWLCILILSFFSFYFSRSLLHAVPNFFSFKGAAYLLPFFLIGVGFYRFKDALFTSKILAIVSLVFVAGVLFQQLTWLKIFPHQTKQSILGIVVGVASVFLLFSMKMKNGMLTWIGSYAYSIFLFHVFFTGGTRIVLLKAGLENKWVILLSALVISLVIPILLEIAIKRSRVLSFCLLGLIQRQKISDQQNSTAETFSEST